MSIDGALSEGRRAAESRMVDQCRITRAGEGVGPWNNETREYDPPEPVTVYEGRCEVQERDTQEQDAVAGEADIDTQRYTVKVPVSVLGIRKDDDVEITVATHDPDLQGRHFTVGALHHKTFATARRLPCVEVV